MDKENNELRTRVANEAIRIGEWLLSLAKKDSSGMWWDTLNMDMERNISWHASESIYAGVSGIVLFFLELHKLTAEPKYMTAASEGMHWVVNYCEKNPNNYYSFFTGRMGVPYTLLKMTEATGENHWTEKALEIARPCTSFLELPYLMGDLINGSAGTVLGLLHLHAATGETWILTTIDAFVKRLIHSAHQGPKGFYWDRSDKNISGLCGFSHGAAGIGWVFLELGHYFRNEAFFRISQQAFLYESHFYDETFKNWQDLRKGIYNDEDEEAHRKAFMENDPDFFTIGSDMNAWCHGAAGIGLSRLRAYELFKNNNPSDDDNHNYNYKLWEQDITRAIEKTTRTDIENKAGNPLFILCHGRGGNAELFLKAYEIFNEKKYLALAEILARKALDYRNETGNYLSGYRDAGKEEDTSLFMGTSGIGYFYLRLLAPHETPSIMIPTVNATIKSNEILSTHSFITISPLDIPKQLLKKYFRRTLIIAEKCIPEALTDFFDNIRLDINTKTIPLIQSFRTFMEKTIPSIPPGEQHCLSDIFVLEREKVKMDAAIVSHSLLNIKEKILNKRARKLIETDTDTFLDLTLILEPEICIATTDWNWNAENESEWGNNFNLEPDTYPLLLKPTPFGIMEEPLSPLSYTILDAFEKGRQVEEARKETIDAFESLTPGQENMLTDKIIEQIKQALLAGILIEEDNRDK
jgi:hypothetical protein